MEQRYIITQSILDALLQYLMTRPYQEVANGVAALRSLPAASDPVASEQEREAG